MQIIIIIIIDKENILMVGIEEEDFKKDSHFTIIVVTGPTLNQVPSK